MTEMCYFIERRTDKCTDKDCLPLSFFMYPTSEAAPKSLQACVPRDLIIYVIDMLIHCRIFSLLTRQSKRSIRGSRRTPTLTARACKH